MLRRIVLLICSPFFLCPLLSQENESTYLGDRGTPSSSSLDLVNGNQSPEYELNSVVVTALGIKREEKALGYSVTELKGDTLDQNVLNPLSALQGKVAGLSITHSDGGLFGGLNILMRGASTLKKDNQPLIVVDGVVISNNIYEIDEWNPNSSDYGNELKNLNPSDIEEVSVLKGAAATALYGSKGFNGVIIITTKEGGKQKGVGVSFSQSFGVDVVTSTVDFQTKYGPGALPGDISYGANKWDTQQFYSNTSGKPTLNVTDADLYGWGPSFDGRQIEYYDGTYGSYSPLKNSYKDIYDAGLSTNTNIAVKGGNDRTTFYTSGAFRFADGTLPNNSFNRSTFLFKGSHLITKRVKLSASVMVAHSKPQNPQPNIGDYYISGSFNQLYNGDYYREKYKGLHGGMAGGNYGDTYANVPGKELWWQVFENSYVQKENNVRPILNLDIDITDWMAFRGEANMDIYHTNRETRMPGTGYQNQGTDDVSGGYYEVLKNETNRETLIGSFNFKKKISNFSFSGFVRGEYWNTASSRIKSATSGGLVIPGQYFLKNSRETPVAEVDALNKKRMYSFVAAANVGWKEQLFLDITGRNDWSSALVYSNATGNYSYFYPSVSTSWIVSETFRDRMPSWVTFAKLRMSWAQVGNDAIPYAINPGYDLNKYQQADGSYIYSDIVPQTLFGKNNQLKPERKKSWEFGLDWRFLQNRLGIDVAYYKENTRDQIMNVALPKETGMVSQLINAGNIQNQGVEIALNTVPYRDKNWQWDLGFTFTKNVNKIIALHPDLNDRISLNGNMTYGNYRVEATAIAGAEYGLLMTDIAPAYDDKGNVILQWDDDLRSAYAKRSNKAEELGSMMPDFFTSAITGIRYKNFSLNVLLDMRFGGLMVSYTNRYGHAYGFMESSLEYTDNASGGKTWTSGYADSNGMTFHDGVIPEGVFDNGTIVTSPSGDRVDVSGMTFAEAYEKNYVEPVHAANYHYRNNCWSTGTINDNWVHEVNYISLREISAVYRLPQSVASKLGARKMSVALTGRDLCYLYNSLPNNLHPESIRGTMTTDFRERGAIPYTAGFMVTIAADF